MGEYELEPATGREPARRGRSAARPRLRSGREAELRRRWTSGDPEVRLTVTEAAIVLGWSVTSVRVYLLDGRMRGTVEERPRGGGTGWRWTIRAGDLREDFAGDLEQRRADPGTDTWV